MNSFLITIFQLIVLIFSVIIHEISHGYVAERLGDPTARNAGRLTLNPLKHIDPFGSVILPLILVVTGSPFLFGWAKPVPYDLRNLKDPRMGAAKIAAAGPISNFILALVFGLALRAGLYFGISPDAPIVIFFALITYINILLGVFNLVPIPPLDGSKVLLALLPATSGASSLYAVFEKNGLVILLLFIFFGYPLITPIIRGVFTLFTGQVF
jgi:Zn-dependent protease